MPAAPRVSTTLLLALLASPALAGPAPKDEIAALSRRFVEASDARDLATLKPLVHPDFVFARPGGKRLDATEYVGVAMKRRGGTLTRTWGEQVVRVGAGGATWQGASKVTVDGVASDVLLLLVWTKEADGWKALQLQPLPAGAEAARERWNAMLKAGATDVPSKFLLEVVQGRAPGKAVDLGMGNGRNTLALAKQGWSVTGVEVSEVGALACWQGVREQGLKNVSIVLQDAQAFDLGAAQYDLAALIYFPVPDYVARVQKALKPGGVVVIEAFGATNPDAGLRPTGDDVTTDLASLKKAFAGWTVLKAEQVTGVAEWGGDTRSLVRFAAQKPQGGTK